MAIVINNPKTGATEITFGNDIRMIATNMGTGSMCQLSWDNVAVMLGLRKMFACNESERIVGIEVDNYGIKAKFERIKE